MLQYISARSQLTQNLNFFHLQMIHCIIYVKRNQDFLRKKPNVLRGKFTFIIDALSSSSTRGSAARVMTDEFTCTILVTRGWMIAWQKLYLQRQLIKCAIKKRILCV